MVVTITVTLQRIRAKRRLCLLRTCQESARRFLCHCRAGWCIGERGVSSGNTLSNHVSSVVTWNPFLPHVIDDSLLRRTNPPCDAQTARDDVAPWPSIFKRVGRPLHYPATLLWFRMDVFVSFFWWNYFHPPFPPTVCNSFSIKTIKIASIRVLRTQNIDWLAMCTSTDRL